MTVFGFSGAKVHPRFESVQDFAENNCNGALSLQKQSLNSSLAITPNIELQPADQRPIVDRYQNWLSSIQSKVGVSKEVE